MGKYKKWITGSIGWALFGPIGALIGFAIGSMLDEATDDSNASHGTSGTGQSRFTRSTNAQARPRTRNFYTGQTSRNGFVISLLVLVSAVLKADDKVMRSELDFVKRYFRQKFGPDAERESLLLLRDLLKQQVQLGPVCAQIAQNLNYSSRLQLLHMLYDLAKADSPVNAAEQRVISMIAAMIGITPDDQSSIKAMFVVEANPHYKILEISPDATDDEVKRAYRKMAMKYHPDKVSHLGDDIRLQAEQKFKNVAQAYERIKAERGMN
ncbi:MAG: TerB family tellurite resistance protein [Bacteroidales bacterium]|nr:TerB family tellurite resistance protein [Bacteroidales bacterium]